MERITHNATAQPHYTTEDGDHIDHWDNQDLLNHFVENKEQLPADYLVFDVETDASPPQRPIFAFAYDEHSKTVWCAQAWQRTNTDLTDQDIRDIVRDEVESSGYEIEEFNYSATLGKTWFSNILDFIVKNDQYDEKRTRSLLGHNIFFDLGMLGGNDDQLLGNKFPESDFDGVVDYADWSMGHRRAGAHGRIYDFRRKLQLSHIPVTDTLTAAKATRLPTSLEDLADEFGIQCSTSEEHGVLNEEYIRYNVNDTLSTLEVARNMEGYIADNFSSDETQLPLRKIYSSASIGKQKLKELGYDRVHYDQDAMQIGANAYFGGQTEALNPGCVVNNVTYTDFLSQYPTASALTGVWDYMQAERVSISEVPVDDLPEVSVEDLREPDAWKQIANYYVVVDADSAMLPVRAQLSNVDTTRVYKADVTHDNDGCVYHYMDVVAAMLHGNADNIQIKKAWRMNKHGKQELYSTQIGGTTIDGSDNLMARCIEERKRIQYNVNGGDKNGKTLALKIVANSLYGVSAERLLEKKERNGELIKYDRAGTYYNPHVATTTTAAGRLMLSLGEIIANDEGGEVHYCDTDSLILDDDVAEPVMDYFNSGLNPYDGVAGTLDFLEIEETSVVRECDGCSEFDTECSDCWVEEIDLQNVDLFSVGVKKYCVLKDGEIVMNKEHGLGHYEQMRDSETVTAFWAELLNRTMGIDVQNPTLTKEEKQQVVWWQTSASTATIRQQLSDLQDKTVRYGDFVKRSISLSRAGEKQYIGLGDNYIEIEHADNTPEFTDTEDGEALEPQTLTDYEKDTLKSTTSFDWQSNGFEAMYAKAALKQVGASEWMNHYEPGMDASACVSKFESTKTDIATTNAPTATTRVDAERVVSAAEQQTEQERAERRAIKAAMNGEGEAVDGLVDEFGWSEKFAKVVGEFESVGEVWSEVREPALTAARIREVESIDESAVKSISEIVEDWVRMVVRSGSGRPTVNVTGVNKVTKEASDLTSAWDARAIEDVKEVARGMKFLD